MKKWLKILFVLLTFALISVLLYLILKANNIANLSTLKNLILKSGKWGYIVYTIILIISLVAFCFVPFLNATLEILGIALFGSSVTFITNLIAIFFSSTILFFIGDKLGEKFTAKLIGKDNLEKTQNLIDHKSKFWLPILFIAPGIPDEALCLVAGMTKIKYWYLILVSLAYHALEIGLLCFIGSGIINWSAFSAFDWLILSNVILIDLYLLFKLEKYLEVKISAKNNKN